MPDLFQITNSIASSLLAFFYNIVTTVFYVVFLPGSGPDKLAQRYASKETPQIGPIPFLMAAIFAFNALSYTTGHDVKSISHQLIDIAEGGYSLGPYMPPLVSTIATVIVIDLCVRLYLSIYRWRSSGERLTAELYEFAISGGLIIGLILITICAYTDLHSNPSWLLVAGISAPSLLSYFGATRALLPFRSKISRILLAFGMFGTAAFSMFVGDYAVTLYSFVATQMDEPVVLQAIQCTVTKQNEVRVAVVVLNKTSSALLVLPDSAVIDIYPVTLNNSPLPLPADAHVSLAVDDLNWSEEDDYKVIGAHESVALNWHWRADGFIQLARRREGETNPFFYCRVNVGATGSMKGLGGKIQRFMSAEGTALVIVRGWRPGWPN